MNSITEEILFENNINNNQNEGNNNSNLEHNENININPSILNNNNNNNNENKMDIMIELQKKLLEVVATSNENQIKLLEAMATSNSLIQKEQENQTELMKEIKEIKINQGTNNSAIELLLNKLDDIGKEIQRNQNQENNDDKGKIEDKEQKK